MVPDGSRILVVDDDDISRTVLAANLGKRGHEVLTARNGREAMTVLAGTRVDVVLLDLLMPDMSGFDVISEMKADDALRSIPVIVISQVETLQSAVRCIEMGATDYLTKPFHPTILQARLSASLAEKRLRDCERRCLAEIRATKEDLEKRMKECTARLAAAEERLCLEMERRHPAEEGPRKPSPATRPHPVSARDVAARLARLWELAEELVRPPEEFREQAWREKVRELADGIRQARRAIEAFPDLPEDRGTGTDA